MIQMVKLETIQVEISINFAAGRGFVGDIEGMIQHGLGYIPSSTANYPRFFIHNRSLK